MSLLDKLKKGFTKFGDNAKRDFTSFGKGAKDFGEKFGKNMVNVQKNSWEAGPGALIRNAAPAIGTALGSTFLGEGGGKLGNQLGSSLGKAVGGNKNFGEGIFGAPEDKGGMLGKIVEGIGQAGDQGVKQAYGVEDDDDYYPYGYDPYDPYGYGNPYGTGYEDPYGEGAPPMPYRQQWRQPTAEDYYNPENFGYDTGGLSPQDPNFDPYWDDPDYDYYNPDTSSYGQKAKGLMGAMYSNKGSLLKSYMRGAGAPQNQAYAYGYGVQPQEGYGYGDQNYDENGEAYDDGSQGYYDENGQAYDDGSQGYDDGSAYGYDDGSQGYYGDQGYGAQNQGLMGAMMNNPAVANKMASNPGLYSALAALQGYLGQKHAGDQEQQGYGYDDGQGYAPEGYGYDADAMGYDDGQSYDDGSGYGYDDGSQGYYPEQQDEYQGYGEGYDDQEAYSPYVAQQPQYQTPRPYGYPEQRAPAGYGRQRSPYGGYGQQQPQQQGLLQSSVLPFLKNYISKKYGGGGQEQEAQPEQEQPQAEQQGAFKRGGPISLYHALKSRR